jgi:hypothetical protein
MSLLAFCKWCEASALGNSLRESLWLFPVIEAGHLLALAVIGGAVLLVDFRLMGFGLSRRPVAEVAKNAQPLLVGSLLVMLVSGFVLFTSEAMKCYYNDAFRMKMLFLFLAMIYTFTIRQKVLMADETRVGPLWSKVVAVVSVLLWSGVGIGGRGIGFY